jgi:hypothetical protein
MPNQHPFRPNYHSQSCHCGKVGSSSVFDASPKDGDSSIGSLVHFYMNQLLGWATSNSQQEPPTEPVDPKWIDVILGKEDAVRMRELMDVITSEQSLDTKLNAFDELELLVESLDNANDLGPLQLWNPLLDVLHSPHEDLQVFALWTIGTAIQNNAKSQTDFYASLGLSKVLDFMRTPRSSKVNQKALYCISSN